MKIVYIVNYSPLSGNNTQMKVLFLALLFTLSKGFPFNPFDSIVIPPGGSFCDANFLNTNNTEPTILKLELSNTITVYGPLTSEYVDHLIDQLSRIEGDVVNIHLMTWGGKLDSEHNLIQSPDNIYATDTFVDYLLQLRFFYGKVINCIGSIASGGGFVAMQACSGRYNMLKAITMQQFKMDESYPLDFTDLILLPTIINSQIDLIAERMNTTYNDIYDIMYSTEQSLFINDLIVEVMVTDNRAKVECLFDPDLEYNAKLKGGDREYYICPNKYIGTVCDEIAVLFDYVPDS
jgi:hypothetical protein